VGSAACRYLIYGVTKWGTADCYAATHCTSGGDIAGLPKMTQTPPWEFTLVMNISSTQEACVSTEGAEIWKTEQTRGTNKHFDPTFQNCVLFGFHPDKSDVLVRADDEDRELCVRAYPTNNNRQQMEGGQLRRRGLYGYSKPSFGWGYCKDAIPNYDKPANWGNRYYNGQRRRGVRNPDKLYKDHSITPNLCSAAMPELCLRKGPVQPATVVRVMAPAPVGVEKFDDGLLREGNATYHFQVVPSVAHVTASKTELVFSGTGLASLDAKELAALGRECTGDIKQSATQVQCTAEKTAEEAGDDRPPMGLPSHHRGEATVSEIF
jgi:hypothetical protein